MRPVARRRSLVTSPLEWQMTAAPIAPSLHPLAAERGGTQLQTPRPVVLVDTREQNPFSFERFRGWFAGVELRTLKLGDYAIDGMEDACIVERKDLADLVHSFTVERAAFLARLRRMSECRDSLLVITAPLSQVKSPYSYSPANPNKIVQSLVAALAGLRVPFLCAETHELGEEIVASYLYQVFLYRWLETHDYGRCIVEDDM